MNTKPDQQNLSDRKRAHEEMLKEALERPGVREIMGVYESWQRADKGLEPYRSATKDAHKGTTTKPDQQNLSDRERAHEEMLKEALKRPGVREIMGVYESWQRADKGLEPYRSATKDAHKGITKKPDQQNLSDRERAHEEMLKEALKRPGIREIMEVYNSWQRADKGLEPYRSATKNAHKGTTTNHTLPIKSTPAKKIFSCQFGVMYL